MDDPGSASGLANYGIKDSAQLCITGTPTDSNIAFTITASGGGASTDSHHQLVIFLAYL